MLQELLITRSVLNNLNKFILIAIRDRMQRCVQLENLACIHVEIDDK